MTHQKLNVDALTIAHQLLDDELKNETNTGEIKFSILGFRLKTFTNAARKINKILVLDDIVISLCEFLLFEGTNNYTFYFHFFI